MDERDYYRSGVRDDAGASAPRESGRSRLSRFFGGERDAGGVGREGSGGTVIYSPSTYEDVQMLIDHLKLREQVIVDFSAVNQTSVYRILDFMSGAVYALSGSMQRISQTIFLLTPANLQITVPVEQLKKNLEKKR